MNEVIAKFTNAENMVERTVSVRSNADDLLIKEVSRSLLASDGHVLVQLVILSAKACAFAGFADNLPAVSRFFSSKDTYLTDLIDVLDAYGVPYRYLSSNQDSGIILRGA